MGEVLVQNYIANGIVTFGEYHRYWSDRTRGEKNPQFDEVSSQILDLKEGKMSAVRYFFGVLDPVLPRDVSICVVPSSRVARTHPGIIQLARQLCSKGCGRIDRTGYLVRTIDVPKLTENRRRGRDIHLASITVDPGMSVYGERVLLLDDVTTTGNSLYACREILISAGAKSVEMFAIGQAVYD
ncbi:MAG: phosphoribosyltransferase [Lachnospiraceae bacterium]|nr:phosphoribosyltransferase [Lachnospiraceae bacterium]